MLFSSDKVSQFINDCFEPVWVSVRPVPAIQIDFGDGNIVRRTLQGNIASYVCTADQRVLSVLPGIYEPGTYLDRLHQFVQLHRWFEQHRDENRLRQYHRVQAGALARGFELRIDGAPRSREGAPLRLRVLSRPDALADGGGAPPVRESQLWHALLEDTRVNESDRRRRIHAHLVQLGLVSPQRMTRWLYREVLNADLDDPYLGLGKTLFGTYPFPD